MYIQIHMYLMYGSAVGLMSIGSLHFLINLAFKASFMLLCHSTFVERRDYFHIK